MEVRLGVVVESWWSLKVEVEFPLVVLGFLLSLEEDLLERVEVTLAGLTMVPFGSEGRQSRREPRRPPSRSQVTPQRAVRRRTRTTRILLTSDDASDVVSQTGTVLYLDSNSFLIQEYLATGSVTALTRMLKLINYQQ